ncbi:MAG: bacteriohemerythrin [Treponema sp.]|jgi:hemerythrin|nr:bacteriohemerythrin [Treponema sp.]
MIDVAEDTGKIAGIMNVFRKAMEISADDIARDIGVPVEVYEKYERGDPDIPLNILYRISNRLRVDATVTLTGKEPWMKTVIVCEADKGVRMERYPEREEPDDETPDDEASREEKREKPAQKQGKEKAEQESRQIYRKGLTMAPENQILEWQRAYSTGLHLLDEQHKEFIELTNELHAASRLGWKYSQGVFMRVIRYAVQHFQTNLRNEEKIMERTGYPEYKAHKREHVLFLKEVLSQVRDFQAGQKTDVKDFVLFLRDWILSHVGICDKELGVYLIRLKREGALSRIIMRVRRDSAQRLIIR